MTEDILLLNGDEILDLFKGNEKRIIETIKQTYQTQAKGQTNLPHSSFLRFPNKEKERIIALPAYLGGDFDVAGIKWIASFPGNLEKGIERASAVLILNSTETGRPLAVMESSVISAYRTAASAALAADTLGENQIFDTLGMIGCGLINFETLYFLMTVRPEIKTLVLYDLSSDRARQFKAKCLQFFEHLDVQILEKPAAVFQNARLIALATTAVKPHISDLSLCHKNSVILHTSLRDLTPEVILSCDNVVDDIDHICRAQTSVHLAEEQVGHRAFIRCAIGDIFNGDAPPKQGDKISVFSPFGLGVLDMGMANLARQIALETNQGTWIKSFFPVSWLDRNP